MIIFIGQAPYPSKTKRYYPKDNPYYQKNPMAFVTPEFSKNKNDSLTQLLEVFGISILDFEDDYPNSLIQWLKGQDIYMFNAYDDLHFIDISEDLKSFFKAVKEGSIVSNPADIKIVTWGKKAQRVLYELPVLDSKGVYRVQHPSGANGHFNSWKNGKNGDQFNSYKWLTSNVKLKRPL
ncbi:hypothetical protein ACA614_13445 [Lactiplantibacillus plantarum]|uniref:hypothetical protein n=1 Tax=Lactiplantibacillus plantarum TaxID=1590 RepID=UPI003C1ACDF0